MTAPTQKPTKEGPFRIAPHVRDGRPTGAWIVDLPPHVSPTGKRERRKFTDKKAATAEAKSLLRQLQLEGIVRGTGPKLSGVTFAELTKIWVEEQGDRLATGKKRASTLIADGYKLKALSAKLERIDCSKIRTRDVADYQKYRIAGGFAAATVNGETSILLQLLKWAQEKGLVERLPLVENIPLLIKRVDIPTIAEVERILTALSPRTRLLVRFLAETGCRKGEAFALHWDDLDETSTLVTIRRKSGFTPKTRHSDRDIPLPKSLMAELVSARETAREKALQTGVQCPVWVFPGKGGAKRVDFRKALATAILTAKVTRRGAPLKLTPHGLRKALATWMHVRGVSDAILQPRLGHAPGSRITASTYVHVTTEDMRAVMIDFGAEIVPPAAEIVTGR